MWACGASGMGSFFFTVAEVWNWAMGEIIKMCQRNLAAFNTTYKCNRQQGKICMYDPYKTQQGSHCETLEQWDSRLLKTKCGAVWRKPTCLWFSAICRWGLLHWHVDIPEQKGTFCASQQLLFFLSKEMTCSTFLYSTVNMLCGSMNRLLTVWQCAEILLYCNSWGVL